MGDIIKVNFKNKTGKKLNKKERKFKDEGRNLFEDIIKKNKKNAERVKRDRAAENKKTKRNYRLDR